jgi:hypothetical protein
MGFNDDVQRGIVEQMKEDYKKAAFWLPFSALEIEKVFEETELEELSEFISDMQRATSDNERIVKISEKAQKYATVIVKLLKMAKILA